MQSEGKSYPFDHLPAIDYDAHPAYGRVMSMPMLGARLKALSYFGYGFLLASAQRIVDRRASAAPGRKPASRSSRCCAVCRPICG